MSSQPPSVDRERTEALTYAIMLAIKANYDRGPVEPERVLEALNALAVASATVIAGVHDGAALEFFIKGLKRNLDEYGHSQNELN